MAEVNKVNLRLITRLVESGITSEKTVMALKLKDILSIPNITKDVYESFPQYGGNMVENREYANEQNEALSLTIEQVAAMENGVIFGWDTPVANPKYYDENGHFYVPVEEPKERRR